MATTTFLRTALRMFAGVIVWAAHFTVIYGFTAVACALGLGETRWPWLSLTVFIVVTTVIALAALLVFAWTAKRARPRSFENWMGAAVAALAALAIVWEGLVPVFMLPACS